MSQECYISRYCFLKGTETTWNEKRWLSLLQLQTLQADRTTWLQIPATFHEKGKKKKEVSERKSHTYKGCWVTEGCFQAFKPSVAGWTYKVLGTGSCFHPIFFLKQECLERLFYACCHYITGFSRFTDGEKLCPRNHSYQMFTHTWFTWFKWDSGHLSSWDPGKTLHF